jgi:DNA-binding transcriptional regulator YiaG
MGDGERGADWDGERVHALRRWLQDSQTELAERLGTRQQTVSEWETGSSRPRRMSRRLLGMVAEDSGYYSVERTSEGPSSSDSEAER